MRVADLRFRPPPRGCETARGRQIGRGGPDERIDLVKDAATLRQGRRPGGFGHVNASRAVRRIIRLLPSGYATGDATGGRDACPVDQFGPPSAPRRLSVTPPSAVAPASPRRTAPAPPIHSAAARLTAAVGGTTARCAGVAQWQSSSLPSWSCGFDSRHPLRALTQASGTLPGPGLRRLSHLDHPRAIRAITAAPGARLAGPSGSGLSARESQFAHPLMDVPKGTRAPTRRSCLDDPGLGQYFLAPWPGVLDRGVRR
jgi:hypothetical protein